MKRKSRFSLTAVIQRSEKHFVALCPELDVVSQGKTVEEDISRIPPMEVVTRQSTDVLAVDDPDVAADWGMTSPVLSDRDKKNPQRKAIDPSVQPIYGLRS